MDWFHVKLVLSIYLSMSISTSNVMKQKSNLINKYKYEISLHNMHIYTIGNVCIVYACMHSKKYCLLFATSKSELHCSINSEDYFLHSVFLTSFKNIMIVKKYFETYELQMSKYAYYLNIKLISNLYRVACCITSKKGQSPRKIILINIKVSN